MATQKIKLLGGNYIYETPEIPDDKDVLYYNLKKEDQYWRIPDEIGKFRNMSVSQKKEFVDRERNRWMNGVWFFNNGHKTYITGMHYDHLVYQTFEFGKAVYLESQRHDFYFREYCAKDPDCFGELWLKPRRYGMTAEEITENQYIALRNYGKQVGIVSNENKKTIDSIFRPIVDSYIKRPKFLRAKIYMPSGKKPKKEMLFQGSVVKEDDNNELFFDTNGDLNGWIIPKPTTTTAYDGMKLHKLTADEVWKWINCNPEEFWEVHKKCLEDGGTIIGKASLLSTMGDSDDYKEAIEAGVRMWHASDPEVRDANNRTSTGLYRYFIDAVYSMRKYRDKYGFIDIKAAEEHLANDLAKYAVGSKEYIFEKRRMPRCPEDALMGADLATTFDNMRLGQRLEIIKKMAVKPYVFANLNELPNGRIEFEPDKYGIWKFANQPMMDAKAGLDCTNRFRRLNGEYYRPVNPEFGGGYDGVNFADVDTVSGNKSRAAFVARQKFDYYGNGGINRYTAMLAYRPEEPDDGHYEAIKCCRYLGCGVMIDRSGLDSIKKAFKAHNMLDYLLKSPKDGKIGLWSDNQRSFNKNGINKIQAYNRIPKNEGDIDWLMEIPWEELIEDEMKVNPLKMTKYDVLIAAMLCEEGLDQVKETNLRDMASSGLTANNPLAPKRRR